MQILGNDVVYLFGYIRKNKKSFRSYWWNVLMFVIMGPIRFCENNMYKTILINLPTILIVKSRWLVSKNCGIKLIIRNNKTIPSKKSLLLPYMWLWPWGGKISFQFSVMTNVQKGPGTIKNYEAHLIWTQYYLGQDELNGPNNSFCRNSERSEAQKFKMKLIRRRLMVKLLNFPFTNDERMH